MNFERIVDVNMVGLQSDDAHAIAPSLRHLIEVLCGELGREQAVACMFVAVQQFKEADGSRELWLSIAADAFDNTILIKGDVQ